MKMFVGMLIMFLLAIITVPFMPPAFFIAGGVIMYLTLRNAFRSNGSVDDDSLRS